MPLAAASSRRTHRRAVLALGAALAFVAAILVPASVSEAAPTLRVLQLNMCGADCAQTSAQRVQEAADAVLARRPDAVSLNEACKADVDVIATRLRAGGHPMVVTYHATIPGGRGKCASSDYGTAVLTRTTPTAVRRTVFTTQAGAVERRAALCVAVVSTNPVWICSTHLEPGGLRKATRMAQTSQLAGMLRGLGGATVLMGDLNEVPKGDALDVLYTAAHGGGASGQFVASGSPCRCGAPTRGTAKIDYVMVTAASLQPSASTVADLVTSDHRLLEGTLVWR